MTIHILQADNFYQAVHRHDIVVVDFSATWCKPCQAFAPIYQATAKKYADIFFATVDIDTEKNLAEELGVQSVPTLMIFRDNVLIFMQSGAMPQSALVDLVEQAKALDMVSVKENLV